MITYLEQPVQLLDKTWVVCGNDEEGEFMVEFQISYNAWKYYFQNKPK